MQLTQTELWHTLRTIALPLLKVEIIQPTRNNHKYARQYSTKLFVFLYLLPSKCKRLVRHSVYRIHTREHMLNYQEKCGIILVSFISAGARPNATDLVIVITDGQSTHPIDTAKQANLLKNKPGVKVVAIGKAALSIIIFEEKY